MTRLSDEPYIHPTAHVTDSTLGRYTEVGAGSHVAHSTLGDYSYCVENTQIAYAQIGKFANIASHVRIYASRHPMDRASLHHFTYRSAWYFEDASDDVKDSEVKTFIDNTLPKLRMHLDSAKAVQKSLK